MPGVYRVRPSGWERWFSAFFQGSGRIVVVATARAIAACCRADRASNLRRFARSLNALDSARNRSAWSRRRPSIAPKSAIPTL